MIILWRFSSTFLCIRNIHINSSLLLCRQGECRTFFFVCRLKTEKQTANREKIEKKQIQRVSIVNLFMFRSGTFDKTAHVCLKRFEAVSFIIFFFASHLSCLSVCNRCHLLLCLTEAPDWIQNDWWCIGRDENNRFFSDFRRMCEFLRHKEDAIFSRSSTINISMRRLIWWQTHEPITDNNRYGINSNAMWNMIGVRSQQNFEWIH